MMRIGLALAKAVIVLTLLPLAFVLSLVAACLDTGDPS